MMFFNLVLGSEMLASQSARQLSMKNGLPSDMVGDILQDSRGFLWIGTNNGLSRYDGYALKNYTYEPFNPDTLPCATVTELEEDAHGDIWIGTDVGLAIFRFDSEKFERFHF